MIAVIDSSAALSLVTGRDRGGLFAQMLTDADYVVAPRLYVAEIGNALWKYYRFEDAPLEDCERALEHCLALPDRLIEDEELAREAFSFACLTGSTVYDCLFMVLARRHSGCLLTADKKLTQVARKHSIRLAADR